MRMMAFGHTGYDDWVWTDLMPGHNCICIMKICYYKTIIRND